jgi:hypothetical protein
LPAGPAAATNALPPSITGAPSAAPKPQPIRQFVSILLSLCLGLFLADAWVSLLDDSLILLFDLHWLTAIRALVWGFATLLAALVYLLLGLTPMIPKRVFIPITLFGPMVMLGTLPLLVLFLGRIQQVAFVISLGQVLFGLSVLYWVQGGFKVRWPLVSEDHLGTRPFSWRNLGVFALLNVLVLAPAMVAYLVLGAAWALNHTSGGFLRVRPSGLTVQVRNYVRQDGKTIQLVPMAHVGDPEFYRTLSQSFPTNAVVLLEGVTDNRNLLTNEITYQRMAKTLGVAEQAEEFEPLGRRVHADVDVAQFTTNTIGLLNLVMLIHARGMNAESAQKLLQYRPPPGFEAELMGDLLEKRNRRVLKEIEAQLPQAEHLIVPWGAAHMPEIARGIQGLGFRMAESHERVVIRFGSGGKQKAGRGRGE